jgi:hypothetical protein
MGDLAFRRFMVGYGKDNLMTLPQICELKKSFRKIRKTRQITYNS